MRAPQRVVWTEGLFMTPQHLQAQDRYHEAYVTARVAALTPYDWGVLEIELDSEALSSGQLQLIRFSGLLADGLALAFEKGEAEAPTARSVEAHFPSQQRSIEVFLAVRREREGQDGADPSTSRFQVSPRPVADLQAATSVVSVAFARPNVQLLFGSENREDFETLKVAELVRDPSGGFALNADYVPPCLRVGAAPFIIAGLRQLLRVVLGKQRELSDSRKQRDAASAEFSASDVTRYLQLNTLNGLIPVLAYLVDAADLPPLQAYLTLIQAVGQLCTFGAGGDPTQMPRFQYAQLGAVFGQLFERAQALLRSVAIQQCIPVPLEARPGGLLTGKLDDERLRSCGQFILTVRGPQSEQQVAELFPKLSKIASASEVQGLIQASAPGVPVSVVFRPPPEVAIKPGTVYFAISTQDGYWKNAIRDRSVAIYVPQALEPSRVQVELLGIPSATSQWTE